MPIATLLLAAGKGTRMNSDRAKVLHPIAGVPMLHHAMAATQALGPDLRIVVTGHQAEAVAEAARSFDPDARTVLQAEQLGTGHAVQQCLDLLAGFSGRVIVLFGDTPFIKPESLTALAEAQADVVVMGFEAADPARYGRLIMAGDQLERIVEWKDATERQREIKLCNSGVLSANANVLCDLVTALENDNAAGEYYLTDLPFLARAKGLSTAVVRCDESETLGINTLAELAGAEAIWQTAKRAEMMADGVQMQAPETVHMAFDTVVGRGAVIEPYVVFGPEVTIESGAQIRAFSHLEGCHVSRGAVVGPYARLRPGAELAEDSRVGNFVEIKNATLGEGAKVNHLSYLGDAKVGAGSNIGAGTITCNYDGVFKHQTVIGTDAFIGSNTMLVAPVSVGDAAMTASGSVITTDVEPGALSVARAPQIDKPGRAAKLMNILRARKSKQQRSN